MYAFALGHIFYIVSLFVEYYVPGNIWYIILPFATAAALVAIYMLIANKVGINFGKKMLPFGLFYLFCLTSMLSSSFYFNILHSFSNVTLVMFMIGAMFFAASDFMLTGSYFKEGQRPKAYNAAYSVCYYVAQFVIAFALFFLV